MQLDRARLDVELLEGAAKADRIQSFPMTTAVRAALERNGLDPADFYGPGRWDRAALAIMAKQALPRLSWRPFGASFIRQVAYVPGWVIATMKNGKTWAYKAKPWVFGLLLAWDAQGVGGEAYNLLIDRDTGIRVGGQRVA